MIGGDGKKEKDESRGERVGLRDRGERYGDGGRTLRSRGMKERLY